MRPSWEFGNVGTLDLLGVFGLRRAVLGSRYPGRRFGIIRKPYDNSKLKLANSVVASGIAILQMVGFIMDLRCTQLKDTSNKRNGMQDCQPLGRKFLEKKGLAIVWKFN